MKLMCLVDNTVLSLSSFWGEHGLAVLVESRDGRVLMDTGASAAVFLHNLEAAGIEPGTIRALVISHGHHDHTGGLAALLERRPGMPLYAHPDIMTERFSQKEGKLRSIGMKMPPEELRRQADLRLSARPQEILPGIWTTGEITGRSEPEGRSPHHVLRGEAGLVPDPYRDDMSLVLETEQGLVLVCGCCHAGLLNTLNHVEQVFGRPVVAIFGGTHLISADAAHLERVGRWLREMPALKAVYPNHCTGERALFHLMNVLGPDMVHGWPAGSTLDLEPSV
jgi:7,8-dihydropterin-6-yl-methyl-4-(beta-D-ribofuranosyl)aminobenzene 5'-phosphate synthase